MVNPQISIVVPIYNIELYLDKCITSVLIQDFKNFELILVVDGSPDNSLNVCEKYESSDDRIIIINKINGGLSDARNEGYKIASGKYIWFLDGDDFLVDNALSYFFNKVNSEVDIFLFNYQEVSDGGIKIIEKFKKNEILTSYELVEKHNNYGVQAWTQIYKKQFLDKVKVVFKKGALYEDVLYNIEVYSYNPLIQIDKSVLLNYVQRENSIMNKVYSIKNLRSLLLIMDLFTSKKILDFYPLKFIQDRHHYYFISLFNFLLKSNLKKNEKNDFLLEVEMKNYKILCNFSDSYFVKKVKRKLFSKKSRFIKKYWKIFFFIIRIDNFKRKINS